MGLPQTPYNQHPREILDSSCSSLWKFCCVHLSMKKEELLCNSVSFVLNDIWRERNRRTLLVVESSWDEVCEI